LSILPICTDTGSAHAENLQHPALLVMA